MAADVLMGTDAHAEAWIRAVRGSARPPGAPRVAAAAAAAAPPRLGAQAGRRDRATRPHSSSSRRRAGGRGSPTGRACSTPPVRSASTSTRSAAAAGSAVAARSCRWRARSRSTGSRQRADHLIAFTEPEERYRERDGLAADRRLGCHAKICGDLVSTCRRSRRSTARSCARRPTRTRSRSTRSCGCTTSRSREPDARRPERRPPASAGGARPRLGARPGSQVDPVVLPGLQQTLRAGAWTATVAVHDGDADHGGVRPGSTTSRSGSRSTSARRPWPGTSATCTRARCWRAPAR